MGESKEDRGVRGAKEKKMIDTGHEAHPPLPPMPYNTAVYGPLVEDPEDRSVIMAYATGFMARVKLGSGSWSRFLSWLGSDWIMLQVVVAVADY